MGSSCAHGFRLLVERAAEGSSKAFRCPTNVMVITFDGDPPSNIMDLVGNSVSFLKEFPTRSITFEGIPDHYIREGTSKRLGGT